MPKEMLINVSEGEECRIALVEDGKLEELYMERTSSTSHVGNIYKGKVTNVEASIQAAFVDFGLGRNGFLHISDLMPSYFGRKGEEIVETVGKKMARRDRPPIQRCLRRGDEIIVQIIKEGIGTKGPTLSSYLSIPGRYLVMMPGVGKMGVSQKIEDDAERRRLRQILDGLKPPAGVGFIIRTAGVGKSKVEIERDLKYLTRLWENLVKKRDSTRGATELYTEGDLVTRTVRDVFTADVERIVIDNADVSDRVKEVIKLSSPRTRNKVELYEEKVPLFHKFGIEREIELMYSRHVPLPSGGSLVIDSTEAIVAIDVNSGKFRDHSDAETTAFKTDLEAADEIARQLRLRDLGGVIICDFIDLRYERHRRELEERLLNHLKNDRAKTKMLRMSQFGIIEMTRQRMRPSLKRAVYFDCPHCKGAGLVKTHESMSLDVMRRLAIAISDLKVVRAELSVNPDVAFYLQNRNRRQLAELEDHFNKRIIIKSDAALGLDEMKLDLFDSRDGLVLLDQLALSSAPHTSQLHTRPHGAGPQQGRGGRGGAGGRQPQQQAARGGPQQGRGGRGGPVGGPPREDVVEEERYAIDRDEEDDQSMPSEPHPEGEREADSDAEEYDQQPAQLERQDPRDRGRDQQRGEQQRGGQRGGGGAGYDRQRDDRPRDDRARSGDNRGGGQGRGDNRGRDDGRQSTGGQRDNRGGNDNRGNDNRGGGRGDNRGGGGNRQQGRRDERQPQGQGRGGNDSNRHGRNDRGPNRGPGGGRRDSIIDERDDRGRGIENGGEDVIVDEDYDNAGDQGGGGGHGERQAPAGAGDGGPGQQGPQGQGEGFGGEEGDGTRRRRRRRRGRRGRGRGGNGGGDPNGPPQQAGQPVQALDGYPSEEGGYHDEEGHEDDRTGDGGYAEAGARGDDRGGYANGPRTEAGADDRGQRDDDRAYDDDEEEPSHRGDHVGVAELGEAPAVALDDDDDDDHGSDVPALEESAVVDTVTPSEAPDEGQAPEAAAPAPAKGRRGGRSRGGAAATAAESTTEEAAPAKRSRSRGGKGRSKKAATDDAAPAAPAKKARGAATGGASSSSRSRSRKKPAAAEAADNGATAEGASETPRAEVSAARIAPSVARTGSADKHMADDEPVEHEPVRRPRSARDLDELPEEFD